MRAWLIAAALLILPLIVYWPTVSHEYGFRDDYAHLREVRERPGWLTQLTSSNGRPVYGVVLEASLRDVEDVQELEALRLASTVLIGFVGLLLWWHLRRSGWTETQAAALGAAVTLLPGAQVVVGWAIAWPIALGLVAAVAGFALVDRGLQHKGPASWVQIAAGSAVVLRRRPHLPDERIVRGHAARGRICSFATARQRARTRSGSSRTSVRCSAAWSPDSS